VHAGTPQRSAYEYKFIQRTFYYDHGKAAGTSSWREDGKELPVNNDRTIALIPKFHQLGSEGWELVTDTTYSFLGKTFPNAQMAANGLTTDETWVFKRLAQ
jgi:hypothetical protein